MDQLVFLQKEGEPISGQLVRQQLGRLVDEMNGSLSSAAKRKKEGFCEVGACAEELDCLSDGLI